jgi:hypothetical protein
MALAPIFISFIALGISIAALWKSHLAPFSPLAVAGRLRVRIYPIRSDDQQWFIASFDVPISVTNEGARPGVVSGLRLRLHFPKVPIPGNCELIGPEFEIALADARKIDRNRFDWIDKLVTSDWMPFTVLSKGTVTKHFVFESRWEEPVVQEDVECTLEMLSDRSDWQKVDTWTFHLSGPIWSEHVDVGTSISYHSEPRRIDEACVPPDLHKYTGTRKQIPKGGFFAGDSYLNYPEVSSKHEGENPIE